MRCAFFGGSFDPVHIGHLILAQEVLEQVPVDRVVFVPAAVPPHKKHQRLAPSEHRLAMIRLAIDGQAGLAVSEVELERDGVSYTIDTLLSLREQTGDEWLVIIGADQWAEITSWKRYEEILKQFSVLLTTRSGVPRPEAAAAMCPNLTEVAVPNIEISATAIRQRIAAGRPITHRVPPAVEAYIVRHGLYRDVAPAFSTRPNTASGRHG